MFRVAPEEQVLSTHTENENDASFMDGIVDSKNEDDHYIDMEEGKLSSNRGDDGNSESINQTPTLRSRPLMTTSFSSSALMINDLSNTSDTNVSTSPNPTNQAIGCESKSVQSKNGLENIFNLINKFTMEFKDPELESKFLAQRLDPSIDLWMIRGFILTCTLGLLIYSILNPTKDVVWWITLGLVFGIVFLITFFVSVEKCVLGLKFVTLLTWLNYAGNIWLILLSDATMGSNEMIENLKNGYLILGPFLWIICIPLMGRHFALKYCAFLSVSILIPLILLVQKYSPDRFVLIFIVSVVGLILSLISRCVMDLFERKLFIASRQHDLLMKVLNPNPSFILSSPTSVYWSNFSSEAVLGVFESSLYPLRIIKNINLKNFLSSEAFQTSSFTNFTFPTLIKTSKNELVSSIVEVNKIFVETMDEFLFSYSITSNDENNDKMQIYLDDEGRIEFATPSMVQFFQRGLEEMKGQSLPALLQSCGSPDHEAIKKRMDENDVSVTIIRVGAKSGHLKFRWIKDSLNQKLYGLVEFFEMTQDSEELRMLKNANKMNKEFLEHTCHEIRNPLGVNVGATEEISDIANQLKDEDSKKKILELCETSKACMNSISRTLDSTLSLEKMKSGQLTLNLFKFSFQKMMKEIVNMSQMNAKMKQLDFEWIVDEMLMRVEIVGDMKKVMEIMRNYLSNAMKFTKEGKVTLMVYLMDGNHKRMLKGGETKNKVRGGFRLSKEKGKESSKEFFPASDQTFIFDPSMQYYVRIEVKDEGMGLDSEEVDRLFVKYSQIRPGEMQEGGGTGLGLNLSKINAELMGGSVGAHSIKGLGSTFYCTFPIFFSMDQVPSSILEKIEGESKRFENVNWEEIGDGLDDKIENMRVWHKTRNFVPKPVEDSVVIFCDDFPSVRRMAIRTLKKLHFKKIEEMEDGTEMVDFFNNNPENEVDVIITDEEMLDMNGSLAVRELRRNGVEIPIVMHSGNALEHQQALFYLRGADGFISKPADKGKIMDATRRFIEYDEEEEEEKKEEEEENQYIMNTMGGYLEFEYEEEEEKKEEEEENQYIMNTMGGYLEFEYEEEEEKKE